MNAPQRIAAVAFDLDGTLVDSAPDIRHALNAALKKEGMRAFELELVRTWIGDGPDALIVRALEDIGADLQDEALRVRLRRAFDMATLAAPLSFGNVYEGIHELVIGLRQVFRLVVVSNKPTQLSRAVLDAAQLLPFLSGVHGANTPDLRKPAPGMLQAAANQLDVPTERLLMVGDSAADLMAAQAAGCPAALVGWGYGAHALPAGIDPWRIDTPMQLLNGLLGRDQIEA